MIQVPVYGISFPGIWVFLLFWVLTTIALVDWDTQTIPKKLNYLVFLLAIGSYWVMSDLSVYDRLLGMFCISFPMFLIYQFLHGFGFGDVRLMFNIGFWLGLKGSFAAFFLGLCLGGIYGIYLLVVRGADRKSTFAFGPFLSIGIAISVYGDTGQKLVDAYMAAWN